MYNVHPSQNCASFFRDPSGFIFMRDGCVYRQINTIYKENYELLVKSGLYRELADEGLLIPHEEVASANPLPSNAYKIIKPEVVPFISYPYEWSFSQLRDAGLLTIEIQKKALARGMSLKDCSAYNIQFRKGKPVFIDTLSFAAHEEGKPWVAYRQFCQHFLAPLALMSRKDIRLNQLLRIYIDGIPLDLASSLLGIRAKSSISLFIHLYLHAKAQKFFSDKIIPAATGKMKLSSFLGLIDNLESALRKMKLRAKESEWRDYYKESNYTPEALAHKQEIVSGFLDRIHPGVVWDLGSNVGMFSRIAADKAMRVISLDNDPLCVEILYSECRRRGESNILPLVFDITNPSPGIGWENNERITLLERGRPDAVLALALVHHLAIAHNLPLNTISHFLSQISPWLIIEFVPKDDSQAQRMLAVREDIFSEYCKESFERALSAFFVIQECIQIKHSKRFVYLVSRI